MKGVLELSVVQVLLAYAFILLVLGIVLKRGIRRERDILVASIRMTLQLVLTGYVLIYLFDNPHPAVTIALILLMEAFAIGTVFRKFKGSLSRSLKKVIALSMSAGTLVCLFYFLLAVVQVRRWYDPQYFIPIAGMIVGNSMTGVSLGVKSLTESMTTRKSLVEEALVLGATPTAATREIVNGTFDAAILPTINSMLGMGIVFLPGMMTGQILSGTAPTTAIAYQIAILLGILGAVSLSVILLLHFGSRTFFNKEDQLVAERKGDGI